jgi:hypothetical protein
MRTYTDVRDLMVQRAPEPNLVTMKVEVTRSSETSEQTYYSTGRNKNETIIVATSVMKAPKHTYTDVYAGHNANIEHVFEIQTNSVITS